MSSENFVNKQTGLPVRARLEGSFPAERCHRYHVLGAKVASVDSLCF